MGLIVHRVGVFPGVLSHPVSNPTGQNAVQRDAVDPTNLAADHLRRGANR